MYRSITMKHHEIPYLELADEPTTNIDIDGTTDEVLIFDRLKIKNQLFILKIISFTNKNSLMVT